MVMSICSVLAFPVNKFRLEYASGCNSAKTCNPLGDDHVGFLPQLMFLSPTECSPDGQSVRFFIEFPNSSMMGFGLILSIQTQSLLGKGHGIGRRIGCVLLLVDLRRRILL
ncbi:hypothetical protein EZV62_008204 [Acer yangbiense]|uniref:Uncharacterized protein n=1 Tax=Acer yangbiense TaxID=1000413 RepID=A0A5C7IDF3_9ROSI|nr:hypothetical protein EZV62_008204 [Acer yangbiense]